MEPKIGKKNYLTPKNPLIYSKAEEICQYLKEQIALQYDEIIRTGHNLNSVSQDIETLDEEIRNHIDLQSSLQKKLKSVKSEIREKLSDDSYQGLDSLVREAERLHDELNGWKYGRLGRDSLAHYIDSLQKKRKSLEKLIKNRGWFENIKKNRDRFISIYDNPQEIQDIAKMIVTTLVLVSRGKSKMFFSPEKQEKYIRLVFDEMKMDDLEFHPFDNISPTGRDGDTLIFDLDVVREQDVRRLFYSTLRGRVMKFAQPALKQIFGELREEKE